MSDIEIFQKAALDDAAKEGPATLSTMARLLRLARERLECGNARNSEKVEG